MCTGPGPWGGYTYPAVLARGPSLMWQCRPSPRSQPCPVPLPPAPQLTCTRRVMARWAALRTPSAGLSTWISTACRGPSGLASETHTCGPGSHRLRTQHRAGRRGRFLESQPPTVKGAQRGGGHARLRSYPQHLTQSPEQRGVVWDTCPRRQAKREGNKGTGRA